MVQEERKDSEIQNVETVSVAKVLKEKLDETRIRTDTEVPHEQDALAVDGRGIFALRDVHALKGKQKCGKSTTLKVLIAALLLGAMFRIKSLLMKPKVLYFDTEQGRHDVKRILEDVEQMTGLNREYIDSQVVLHALRRCDREQLMPMLRAAIEIVNPDVVLIDGLVDFVESFNNESESKQIVNELLVLSEEFDCAIICVLHTNKSDEDHNMRGHLGTMLGQKSGTVLECKKENGVITVSSSDTRHAEMPRWSIMYDEEGHIVDADEHYQMLQEQRKAEQEQKRKETTEKLKREQLDKCLSILRDNGGALSRKQLTEKLTVALERERPTVSSYISQWLKDKALVEDNGVIQVAENTALPF